MFHLPQSLIGSQGGRVPLASRGQRPRRRQAKHSARSAATLRAGAQSKRSKALKGCGGKQEFSPTSNTLSLLNQASETVRRTVSEEHYTSKL